MNAKFHWHYISVWSIGQTNQAAQQQKMARRMIFQDIEIIKRYYYT